MNLFKVSKYSAENQQKEVIMKFIPDKLTISKKEADETPVESLKYDIALNGNNVQYRFLKKSEIVMIPDKVPKLILTYDMFENGTFKIDELGNKVEIRENYLLNDLEVSADIMGQINKTYRAIEVN